MIRRACRVIRRVGIRIYEILERCNFLFVYDLADGTDGDSIIGVWSLTEICHCLMKLPRRGSNLSRLFSHTARYIGGIYFNRRLYK